MKCIAAVAVTLALAVHAGGACAQEEGFGLDEVVRATVRVHPLLMAGAASVRAAGYDAVAAGVWQNPTVNVLYTRSFGFTTYDPTLGYTQLTAQQFLDLAGLPTARRRAAEALRDAVAADVATLRAALAYDAAAAFVNLAAMQRRVDVLRESVTAITAADRIVRARVTAGAAPQYDASRIALALAELRAEQGDAEADVVNARGLLDVAVGPGADALRGEARMDFEAMPAMPPLAGLPVAGQRVEIDTTLEEEAALLGELGQRVLKAVEDLCQ